MASIAPLFSWGKSYDDVIATAAQMFGIEEHEFEINLTRGRVVNAAGENVSGTFRLCVRVTEYNRVYGVYVINVRQTFSRPMTIQTIFHEFAHAAQHKFRLCFGGLHREQHAELLAFNKMWHGGFWWDALHMLGVHGLRLKPSDYLVPRQIMRTMLTGEITTPINFV